MQFLKTETSTDFIKEYQSLFPKFGACEPNLKSVVNVRD